MNKENLSTREKVVVTLVVFLIQMIKPWQYDHQFKAFWEELKSIITKEV